MKKVFLGIILTAFFIGGYTTFAHGHRHHHHGGFTIGISPFIAIRPPSIVIGGPPVIVERHYTRRYVRRHARRRVIRRKVIVQQLPVTTGQTTVVTEQLPPPPPPPPAPSATTETVGETTVVQPTAEVEVWHYTHTVCCYVYFEQQWKWDNDLWFHHHYRGHYYERNPQYWARYGFNDAYWRRYEQNRWYVKEGKRWIMKLPPPPPPPPAPAATTETVVETTVVQPTAEVEVWYSTHTVCCYVYFEQQWKWDNDLWFHHHYRGHYYERNPRYWARYGFNDVYWRRYEQNRRYVKEGKRWIIEGHVRTPPPVRARVHERVYVQRDWGHYDRGRHLGWEHQRKWRGHGGEGRGWKHREHHEWHGGHHGGGGHGHGHGHGHKHKD